MMQFDPNYVQGLVTSLNSLNASQEQISTALSTGLRVTKPSDDPTAAGDASLLNVAISADDQFVQTESSTQSMMQVTDTALGSVVTQLTSAISLAVAGNDGSLNSADMATIAQQLENIQGQVMDLANSSYQGTYLFAGSQGGTQPFTLDTSTTPATVTYNGDSITGSVTTPNGQTIQTGLAGSAVFQGTAGNVMSALSNLIADFSSGTPSANAATDIGALKDALSNVSSQRAVLDSSLNRLESAGTYFQTDETQELAAQTSLVQENTAAAATALSSNETQTQALMSVISADEKPGLFSMIQL